MMTTINDINRYKSITVNPLLSPDQLFELYSVPSFDNQYPEVVTGKEIGSTKVAVQENDVLICKINPRINRVWVVKHNTQYPLIASSEWIVVRSPENDSNYLKWYFSSPQFKNLMVSQVTGIGGSLTRAQPKQVATYPVPLPDFPIQRRIANTLDKVSEGITLGKKMLDELDLMVKAKFVEMFGTLPANELGWSTGTIRDCVTEVRYGSSRKAAEGDKGQYPYLRMNNITYDGELDLTDIKSIDIPDDELDKCSVRRGDVLFNRTNSRELVGKTCVYNRDELMVLAGFVVRVRANERMLPEFLSAFMNSTFTKRLLLSMCKTAIGQANINAQEFQNIEIYIPPITLQREFVDFKEQIDKSKLTIRGILDKMEMEKLALMQEYFG